MPGEISSATISQAISKFDYATRYTDNGLADLDGTLRLRQKITEAIEDGRQYSIGLYMDRQAVYAALGYPDLAVMDAYKASLLVDELQDEDAEFHEQATEALEQYLRDMFQDHGFSYSWCKYVESLEVAAAAEMTELVSNQSFEKAMPIWIEDLARRTPLTVASHLRLIGCLRSALTYLDRLAKQYPGWQPLAEERELLEVGIQTYLRTRKGSDCKGLSSLSYKIEDLPDQGNVRREVYPWNNHESDRQSAAALALLNEQLAVVAPKLEVRATELPDLAQSGNSQSGEQDIVVQLGVFAKEDISPGEVILTERSMLTANVRLHELLCDACSAKLPESGAARDTELEEAVACEDCDDTVFCSRQCHDLAQGSYHAAVCGTDTESLAKGGPKSEAANALYTQLLFRSLSLAKTQEFHPLELKEVKYIWGDFVQSSIAPDKLVTSGSDMFQWSTRTLPFTFNAQVLQPLHFLMQLDLSPFEAGPLGEAWIYNTLYAKLRGTASARISEKDGRPEVAAVHPLWCLANHSCDPNVQWEWAGEIKFHARQRRAVWKRQVSGKEETQCPNRAGIAKDEEILNHYVDLELPVKDRREWGQGSLGGDCMCARCRWEDASESHI